MAPVLICLISHALSTLLPSPLMSCVLLQEDLSDSVSLIPL